MTRCVEYRVYLSPNSPSVYSSYPDLPSAIQTWDSWRKEGAWIEKVQTTRIVSHRDLTDAGAADIATRVAWHSKNPMADSTILENLAMPRMGEYRPDVFRNVNEGKS